MQTRYIVPGGRPAKALPVNGSTDIHSGFRLYVAHSHAAMRVRDVYHKNPAPAVSPVPFSSRRSSIQNEFVENRSPPQHFYDARVIGKGLQRSVVGRSNVGGK